MVDLTHSSSSVIFKKIFMRYSMSLAFIATPFQIGSLQLSNRLIQGPLAGVSAAPFRKLFYQFCPPAYTVTEMISAHDVLYKHDLNSRYLYRAKEETCLSYQLSGVDPNTMALAALKLEQLGADLIDINCGCPKAKIRKKGAGSALMDTPERLCAIVSCVRKHIQIPLTVKLRIYGTPMDVSLAQMLEQAGADALIIHGRKWTDDYDKPCDFQHINLIKQHVRIPVIANGDIRDTASLDAAICESQADAYMISRAGCGRPWLYEFLLHQRSIENIERSIQLDCFLQHIRDLGQLESDYQAVMQSKTLVRYYFRQILDSEQLKAFYTLASLKDMTGYLENAI